MKREKVKAIETNTNSKNANPLGNWNKTKNIEAQPELNYQTIEREYHVEYYTKRGLSKSDSTEYIINKLKMEKLIL